MTRLLLEGRSQEAERTLRQRFLAWERAHRSQAATGPQRRTVAEIDAGRAAARQARLMSRHGKRAAWVARLAKAGFIAAPGQ